MDPEDEAVGGSLQHQAKDEAIWKKAIKDLKLDDQSNCKKEHLDFCCGRGRLILKVVLLMNNKFKHCTGVDFSSRLTRRFKMTLNDE